MKKIVFSACMLLSAVLAFNSINKNKVNVFNDNVEALSMKEFDTGYSMLFCEDVSYIFLCYSVHPVTKEEIGYPSKGGSVELFYLN